MNAARNFLRYVSPGLLFIIEFALFTFIFDAYSSFAQIKKMLTAIGPPQGQFTALIALTITALVASGGLGYLFSTIHHCLYWWGYWPWGILICDHKGVLRAAEHQGLLSLSLQGGEKTHACRLSRRGAWRVLASVWHERLESSQIIRSADPRAESLTDLMHGAGTAFVASFSAGLIFWFFVLCADQRWSAFALAPLTLAIIHFLNYVTVMRHTKGFVETVLLDHFSNPAEKEIRPILLKISKRELSRLCWLWGRWARRNNRRCSKTFEK